MAIVKCAECQKEISTTAKACPHCGAKSQAPQIDVFIKFSLLLIAVGILGAAGSAANNNSLWIQIFFNAMIAGMFFVLLGVLLRFVFWIIKH